MVDRTNREPWFRRRGASLGAFAVALFLLLLAPFGILDQRVTESFLRTLAPSNPPEHVFLLTANRSDFARCADALPKLLADGEARGAILFGLSTDYCAVDHPAIAPLPRKDVRANGTLAAVRDPRLSGFGLTDAPYALRVRSELVPSASLSSFLDGGLSRSVLKNRIVVVTPLEEGPSDSAIFAAALDAALLERSRSLVHTFYVAGILFALLSLSMAAFTRTRSLATLFKVSALSIASITLFGFMLLSISPRSVLPLVTLSFAALAGASLVGGYELFLREYTKRLTVHRQSPTMFGSDVLTAPEGEFFDRIEALAKAVFPCEFVLMAVLPESSWHLRFIERGVFSESLIKERRRDVRRTPFSDERGLPKVRLALSLLHNDVPALVVPLLAQGQLEGILCLCGGEGLLATDRDAFLRKYNDVAHGLSRDLGLLFRLRREHTSEESRTSQERDWRDLFVAAKNEQAEVHTFERFLHELPQAVAWVDLSGMVTRTSAPFAKILRERGVELAPKGKMALSLLIEKLAGVSEKEASQALGTAFREEVRLPLTRRGNTIVRELLEIKALRHQAQNQLMGFVVTVREELDQVRLDREHPREKEVFEAILVTDFMRSAFGDFVTPSRRELTSSATITVQPKRLADAFQTFVEPFIERTDEKTIDVVLRERSTIVQIALNQLQTTIPAESYARAYNNSDWSNVDLEHFRSLVEALEYNHGLLEVYATEGFKLTLIVTFTRRMLPTKSSTESDVATSPMGAEAN